MKNEVPIWEKFTLTIDEAATYFRFSKDHFREFVRKNPQHEAIIWNGNRAQIKREKMEEYINNAKSF